PGGSNPGGSQCFPVSGCEGSESWKCARICPSDGTKCAECGCRGTNAVFDDNRSYNIGAGGKYATTTATSSDGKCTRTFTCGPGGNYAYGGWRPQGPAQCNSTPGGGSSSNTDASCVGKGYKYTHGQSYLNVPGAEWCDQNYNRLGGGACVGENGHTRYNGCIPRCGGDGYTLFLSEPGKVLLDLQRGGCSTPSQICMKEGVTHKTYQSDAACKADCVRMFSMHTCGL
ncbi:MAG: hypothetical protein ACFN4U_04275, partial [Candidatus Absconditicoccaceae bacterium]